MSALSLTLPLSPAETGRPQVSLHWCQTRDGDPLAVELYRRHYSCQDPPKKLRGGNFSRISGQGGSIVLVGADGSALFVWRRERYRLDRQTGVNCAVFRNEGRARSSDLIREACNVAWERWPGERLFTFVNAEAIRSNNPGFCFLAAGWRRLPERTKTHGHRILELLPATGDES